MKPFLCSILWLLLSDVLATYHSSVGDPQLIAAQSYAQTRNHGRPPFRTLNPQIHRSDYTYRGGYHYRYQPPWMYRPVPLSPPVTYHRPPFHNPFSGPVAPRMHHVHKGLSPPVAQHPRQRLRATFPYKFRDPCPNKSDPTVPTAPVVPPPAVSPFPPAPTARPTLPATTVAPLTTGLPAVVTSVRSVETTAPVRLLVSTQRGFIATVSPVETGPEPCAMGHDCEHICVNSNASHYCQCRNGYVLNADKKTCSPKREELKAEVVVEDPCKCEATLAFQKQTHAAIQQLTAKLAAVSGRIERLQNIVGRA